MIDLDERNHIIELKFQLTVEWFEYRATYQNLKTNKALNVLSSQELKEIWIPYIIFKVILYVYEPLNQLRISDDKLWCIIKSTAVI